MKSKIANILFSTRLMAVLFIAFAVAMAVGTFLDMGAKTSPTPYSRALVYNTWWFETIMAFFMINFAGNMFRYRLFRKEKWATLLLHLAFVLIILGAFVTRYVSFEGMMLIREGETSQTFLSSDTFLKVMIDGNYKIKGEQQRKTIYKPLLLSEKLNQTVKIKDDYNQQPFTIEKVDFVENAENTLVPSDTGDNYLKLVEAGAAGRHDHFLKEGSVTNIHNRLFAFNKPTAGAINFYIKNDSLSINTPFEGTVMRMADQKKFPVAKDSVQTLKMRSLYQLGDLRFVLPDPVTKGEYKIVKAKDKVAENALTLKITANNQTKQVTVLGGKGIVNTPKTVKLGDLEFHIAYGAKEMQLPFAIKLNDFIADKYPGNMKAFKAFKSRVTVKDGSETFDYDIFMNNILDHKGYKFFQAGFDPDEKGTHLSVNHDFWGTWISYFGYGLLYLAMLAILFAPNTRFSDLRKQLKKVKAKKQALLVALLLISSIGIAQNHDQQKLSKQQIDSIVTARAFDKQQAAKFGELVIQDFKGRMKPLNTYALDFVRKLSGKETYNTLDANQVFLSIIQNRRLWFEVPMLKLKRGNDSIRKVLGVPLKTKYVALSDFFDEKGNYKITNKQLEDATSAFNPNNFQKDIKRLYEQGQLFSEMLYGNAFRVYPIPNDPNNKWVTYSGLSEVDYGTAEANKNIKMLLPAYISALQSGKETGNYKQAETILNGFKSLQKKYSAHILPSENKIKAEIIYNKIDIFKKLMRYYGMFGIILFIILIVQIFKDSKPIRIAVTVLKVAIVLSFIAHTAGLIMRWYVSGHAPWSDAYESIIYVAWATMLFGLIFGKKSDLTLASTAFVTTMLLWVAHMNFIDPAIGNLQPVLNSYWLMIHVAIIVASYGPFTLGAILGIVGLLLMLLTNQKNKKKIDLAIKEITIINEMALTVGLVMLTIGNFLGGMWANESWGRYWGWDPKETWALISIMVYAFVVHMRLVPGLRSRWFFNWMSILAFASIIFTYFGVNFYLVGLHSYASGDKTMSNNGIIIAFTIWIILGAISYPKFKKYYKK